MICCGLETKLHWGQLLLKQLNKKVTAKSEKQKGVPTGRPFECFNLFVCVNPNYSFTK